MCLLNTTPNINRVLDGAYKIHNLSLYVTYSQYGQIIGTIQLNGVMVGPQEN